MNNDTTQFWKRICNIIDCGFTPEGLNDLEEYAEQFNERKVIYKRFSPQEQYGCTAGGVNHVIASLLAGAKVATSEIPEGSIPNFKSELKLAKEQIETIKHWAIRSNCWIENVLKMQTGQGNLQPI